MRTDANLRDCALSRGTIRESAPRATASPGVARRDWWHAWLWLACASCSSAGSTAPALPAVQRIVIETGTLSFVEMPLRGRTQVVVFARAADGTIVRDVPVPELISRDTTRFVVEPGLWVRSVGAGGSTTLVARMVVGGRTFLDSVRVGTVIPLN